MHLDSFDTKAFKIALFQRIKSLKMNGFFSKKDKYILCGFFGAVVFIIICATSLLVWYQNKDHTYATIAELKALRPQNIDSIIIKKYEKSFKFYKTSLVMDDIIIKKADKINNIWNVVNFNNSYSPGHPVAKWLCYFEIKRKNGDKYTLIVRRLRNSNILEERGTLIEIWTHIDAGNIIGSFRCDKLGIILESIAKEKGKYNAKGISIQL